MKTFANSIPSSFKKVTTVVIVMAMLISLAACNSKQDDKIVSETNETMNEETILESNNDIEIASSESSGSSEETTETVNSNTGLYTYDVDGVEITLRTHIEDYINPDEYGGWEVNLLGIATSLGYVYNGPYPDNPEEQIHFYLASNNSIHVLLDNIEGRNFYRIIMYAPGNDSRIEFARNDIDNDSIISYWIANNSSNAAQYKINFEQIVIYTFCLENGSIAPSEDWMETTDIATSADSVFFVNK